MFSLAAAPGDPYRWPLYPSVVAGLLILAAGYFLAVTRWRDRFAGSAPVPRGRVAAFLGGLACIAVALQTPLDTLSDTYLFSAHMVQHLLLTLVGPPLLLYGTPSWLLRPLVQPRPLLLLGRVLTGPLVAFALFNVVFLAYHVPSVLDPVLTSELAHAVTHLLFIATAVITWWPVLSPLPELPRLPYPGQMLYLFLQTLPAQILGAILTLAETSFYSHYQAAPRLWEDITPTVDQQLGGLIMWVGGGTFYLGVFVVVFLRWAALNEAGETQRVPGRA